MVQNQTAAHLRIYNLEPQNKRQGAEEMELKDIMVQSVVTVESAKSVKETAKRMNLYEIGCLIVVDKGKVAGILTERDILTKVVET